MPRRQPRRCLDPSLDASLDAASISLDEASTPRYQGSARDRCRRSHSFFVSRLEIVGMHYMRAAT
eukprot:3699407-Prymnesium_polylepis.1